MRQRAWWGWLAIVLWVSGCATAPDAGREQTADRWEGRIALQVLSEPPQHYSAAFELYGDDRMGELRLLSPLGQVLGLASWSPAGALLKRGNETRTYDSLQALTADLTGTALPIASLFGWLAGTPASAEGWDADLSRHSEGRITARRIDPLPAVQLRIVYQ